MTISDITYDQYAETLHVTLDAGEGIHLRLVISGGHLDSLREQIGSGSVDVSDAQRAAADLRERLSDAQSTVQQALREISSQIEEIEGVADCGSDLGSALDNLDDALGNLDR